MNKEAIKELLIKMADDALIIGHRNSEWTGLGPVLEEDLAFSSMAQDKVGHAFNLYTILHERFGVDDPDNFGFLRDEKEYKCCHLVEYPIGEYDFSLIRHFLFDHAEFIRYDSLQNSSFEPLAHLARKFRGEIKFHLMHANTWVRDLANGDDVSKSRMQSSLNELWDQALGIFEPGDHEEDLINDGVFMGEEKLKEIWLKEVTALLEEYGLTVPDSKEPAFGGRKGYHTEHLKPLLDEMSEVLRLEEGAEW